MGGLENDDLASISRRVKLKEDILTAANKTKPLGNLVKRTDYSAFRTPSGQYYCAACNLSLNSDSQFGQHQMKGVLMMIQILRSAESWSDERH